MPYSEKAHSPSMATLLSTLSAARNGFGNFVIPFLPALRLPTADLHGKQVIVTGANSGIGFETAKALATMGAHVVLACRNIERGEQATRQIAGTLSFGQGEVEFQMLDCAKLESVRDFVRRWGDREVKRIDILINNAGGILNTLAKTPDGFEDAYQSNHLSHFLLTLSLLNDSHFAHDARIITVSSISFFSSPPLDKHNTDSSDIVDKYKEGESLPWSTMVQLCARAKAAQAVWSMVLQRKLEESVRWKGIVAQACHPGTVKSSMLSQPSGAGAVVGGGLEAFKKFVEMFGISNEQGAVMPVWLAIAEEPVQPDLRGLYWDRMRWMWVAPWSLETERQERLWDKWCLDAKVYFP